MDPTIRWYYRSDRFVNAALRVLRGAFDGVWLGILNREQLARIDEVYYNHLREYMTESHNRRGLFAWEQAAVDHHFSGIRRIIVTSAGGGREMLALAKAGYEVAGYEPHEDLACFGNRLLKADGVDATIATCDRDAWPREAGEADGVIVGWSGYMLTAGRARRVAFLREAARRLPVGAPVLVSFFVVEGRDIRLRTAARIATPLRWLLRREPVTVGDALVPNSVHFFTRDELEAELADGGLDLVDFGNEESGWAVGRVRSSQEENHG
ncbi:MAG: hypothetical protein QOC63_2429 [Mycobacterium sp.]|jgi:hypothetical protein|nr:hypothetical protein [Mycobacterium sp.]